MGQPEFAVIQVTAEHALIAWQQPSGALFSDAEQQLRSPGDKFFEFAAQMAEAAAETAKQAEAGQTQEETAKPGKE